MFNYNSLISIIHLNPLECMSYIFLACANLSLLTSIIKNKNCTGISAKTHVLYTVVLASKYLGREIFQKFDYFTNSLPLIYFLILSYFIVLALYFFYYSSYQSHYDTFRCRYLILPSIVLSFVTNYGFDIISVTAAFSLYLEAMAIIPQLYFCSKAKKIENKIYNYIILMTLYKLCIVMHEVYKYNYISKYFDRFLLAAGVLQLIFYLEFFILKEKNYDIVNIEAGNKVPSVFTINPKEVEAMRSSVESAAKIAAERRTFGSYEIYLTPSRWPVVPIPQNESQTSTIPTTEEHKNSTTQVHLPIPDLTISKTDVKQV